MKERFERGCGNVWPGKSDTDSRSCMKWLLQCGSTMRVFLQEIIWSAWHSLRAGWWAYHILIALVRGKMGKAAKKIYRFWGGQVHDIIRWRQVHDIYTSYNQIYLVGPVKEVKSGKNITLQGLVSGMELSLYSTALRCGSFSEKSVEKKHLCRHDKNY